MTDIQHIKGTSNILAHLSRNIAVIDISSGIDFEAIVSVQKNDEELRQFLQQETSSLQMKAIYIPQTKTSLWYDISMENIFIYSKKPQQSTLSIVSKLLAGLSEKLRFSWHQQGYIRLDMPLSNMSKTKVVRHMKSAPAFFSILDTQFDHVHIDITACQGY